MRDGVGHSSAEFDGALDRERDRIVVTLRALADTIAATPLPRLSTGITWLGTATDALVHTMQRALRGNE